MSEPQLRISIEGATAEEIERGLAAAMQVFDDAETTAWAASSAAWRVEMLDIGGVYAMEYQIEQLRKNGAPDADIAAAEADLAALQSEPDMHPLTDREHEIADLWRDADLAAARACCTRWDRVPSTAKLELVMPEDA